VRVNRDRGSASFEDNAICYALPVLWMTSCLSIIGQAKAMLIGRILSDSQGAGAGNHVPTGEG